MIWRRISFVYLSFVLSMAAAAAAAPVRQPSCPRAVNALTAEASRQMLALVGQCEQAALRAGAAGGACLETPELVQKVAATRGRLARKIARACGGDDGECGTADDQPLATLGWERELCPGAGTDPGCPDQVRNCGDLAACLACRAAAGARAFESYFGAVVPASGAAKKCAGVVGREAGRFLGKQLTALEKCWDRRVRGQHADDCAIERKTAAAIAAARTRQNAAVCRACGGADHHCDGVGDVTPAAVAFGDGCPDAPRAGGGSCRGDIRNVTEVVICTDCLAESQTACAANLGGGGPAGANGCQPGACCGPVRMVLVNDGAARFDYGPFSIPDVTAALRITVDIGPADASCRHPVVVPSGGLRQGPYCVPGSGGESSELVAPGCLAGRALGHGTWWDGHTGAVDNDLLITADTTDDLCSPPGLECKNKDDAAGSDVLGGVVVQTGDGTPDPAGAHLQLELPVDIVRWTRQGQCPDPDEIFADGKGEPSTDHEILRFTTARARGAFADMNGDACAAVGSYAAAVERQGAPAPGPCCVVGQRLDLAVAAPAFTNRDGFRDLAVAAHIPMRVEACEPWPGPAETCDVLVGGGQVATKFTSGDDVVRAVVEQPDGKLVAVGTVQPHGGPVQLGLARYLPDGHLDPSFGPAHTGKVIVPLGAEMRIAEKPLAVAPDGKLVVVVSAGSVPGGPVKPIVLRFDADGFADTSFATDGVVRTQLFRISNLARGVSVYPDGRVLVSVGECAEDGECEHFVRLLGNGTPDPSFGTNGVVPLRMPLEHTGFTQMHIAPDGTIIASGYVGGPGGHMVVARFSAHGVPDPTYGVDGVARYGGYDGFNGGLAVLEDGSVLANGTEGDVDFHYQPIMVRLTPQGTPDPTFGDGGFVREHFDGGFAVGQDLVVRPDGTIIVAGAGSLLAYDATGKRLTTFGTDGRIRLFGDDDWRGADTRLILQTDGKLVSAGYTRGDGRFADASFALARLLPDGTPDMTFNGQCPWK